MSTEAHDDTPEEGKKSIDDGQSPSKVDWRLLSADLVLKIAAFVPLCWIPSMSAACRAFSAACDDDSIWQALCKAQVLKSTLNGNFVQ